MQKFLPPLSLTNAQILRDGALQHGSIGIAEGLLQDSELPQIDLSGYLVLPGIIDLHGDGFERHLAPRPTAPFPLMAGLASFDREAASHGVTTAYMAQGWSWEGGLRGPEQAETLMKALKTYRAKALTDLRIQLRAETHLIGETERLIAAVQRFGIDYVIWNDHLLEGQTLAREAPANFAHWAHKAGSTAQALLSAITQAAANHALVPQSLQLQATAFDAMGVAYGSHDDTDAEMREYYLGIGAKIAEFPLSKDAATCAQNKGSPVIMGAPNVVRGGSQAGNVSAQALIADGLCDALVSDYHIPALPLAVWSLVDGGVASFAQAWGMVSTRPAAILNMQDRGRIDLGLRADLVVVHAQTRAIEATISGGQLSYLAGEAAERFLGLKIPLSPTMV
jgi:alpha-D-ribose 1-methylphosphonate 5-triphosphate diphosphatase